jgi:hypothetical protein
MLKGDLPAQPIFEQRRGALMKADSNSWKRNEQLFLTVLTDFGLYVLIYSGTWLPPKVPKPFPIYAGRTINF